MRSGFSQIGQNAQEFALDVHIVTGNFMGNQNWQWLTSSPKDQEGGATLTSWQNFTNEMMTGTQFYTNDSNLEDRITLGLCAALYTFPYFAARLFYDAALNTFEYGTYRLTGKAYSPLHPEGRQTNGYVFGTPISAPFIVTFAAIETSGRIAGISSRAKQEVKLAAKSVGYLLSHWSKKSYSYESDFKPHVDAVFNTPQSGWDVADIVGLSTGGLVASSIVLTTGTSFAVGLGAIESTGRALGISKRVKPELQLAKKAAGFLLSPWTRSTYTFKNDVEPYWSGVTAKIESWWDFTDCIGLATGGLVLSSAIIGSGAILAGTAAAVEISVRSLGFSAHVRHEVLLASKMSRLFFKPWFNVPAYAFDEDFLPHIQGIFQKPESLREIFDFLGIWTGGLAISTLLVGGGALVATTIACTEVSLRIAGFSERVFFELCLAGDISRFFFTHWLDHTPHYAEHWEKVTESPHSFRETLNCVGLVPGFGLSIALITTSATVATAMGTLEVAARILGFTRYGGHIIQAAGKRAANLSPYTRKIFGKYAPESIDTHEDAIFTFPKNGWEAASRLGMITIPGAIAAIEMLGAASISLVAGLTEGAVRTAGVSNRTKNELQAAFLGSRFLLKRWTGEGQKNFSEALKTHLDAIKKKPESFMENFDYIGLATTGLTLSSLILVGGGALAGAISLVEIAARTLGYSEYGSTVVKTAGKRAANMSPYTRKLFGIRESVKIDEAILEAEEDTIFHLPSDNGWEIVSRLGLITVPGVIAAGTIIGAVGITILGATGEGISRVLGLSEYGKTIIKAAFLRSATMSPYTKKLFKGRDEAEITDLEDIIFSWPHNISGALDRAALLTFPAMIAALEMTAGLSLTAIAGSIESSARALGISKRAQHEVGLTYYYTRGLFERWIKAPNIEFAIGKHRTGLTQSGKGWMNAMDFVGLFTGGFAASAIVATTGITLAAITAAIETSARVLGISAYSSHIIKAASLRAANMSAYTQFLATLFSKNAVESYDALLEQHERALKASIKNGWDLSDRLGLMTFPGLISASILAASMGFSVSIGCAEATIRALGLSSRVKHEIILAGLCASYFFKRWHKHSYTADDFETQLSHMFKRPASWRDGFDCIGLATGGLILSGAIISTGSLAAGSLFTFEVAATGLGFSTRVGHEIILAWNVARYLLQHWKKRSFDTEHDFKNHLSAMFKKPENGWETLSIAGLFTGGLALSTAIVASGAALAASLTFLEGGFRFLGFSKRTKSEILLAWRSSGYLLKRWTKANYADYDFGEECENVFASPNNAIEISDYIGLFTGGLAVSSAIFASGFTLAACCTMVDSLARSLGLSSRNYAALSVILNRVGTLFGASLSLHYNERMAKATAPIKSWWDFCDITGTALWATSVSAFSVLALPFAVIGLSKSNYHRFAYHKHRISNIMDQRRNYRVDKTLENYHREALKRCEKTTLGHLFSQVNVVHALSIALYGIARCIVAPIIYGALKLISAFTIKAISQLLEFLSSSHEEPNNSVSKVKKRFADLKLSLDVYGHLPKDINSNAITEASQKAKQRSLVTRAGLSFFSEGRKIIALGHTPAEKVIAEFEDKFNQYVSSGKRQNNFETHRFFTQDVSVKNGERFSYDYMRDHVKSAFTSPQELQEVDRVAEFIKAEIEAEFEPGRDSTVKKLPDECEPSSQYDYSSKIAP